MYILEYSINYLAVLVAGIVAGMGVGMLWYGPLFGKPWSLEMGWGGMTPEQIKAKQKAAMPGYLVSLVLNLVTAFVFLHVLQAFKAGSVGAALQGAAWMWLGFQFPLHVGKKLWMDKSWKLVAIDAGYSLVSLAVMAAILVLWK